MKICQITPSKLYALFAVTIAFSLAPALADSDSERQGFAEYNSGNYTDAMGHLQGALATDFNNPKLHYYLANTYIHLNQRDAGIREFRIAYALDPDKEVGKLSKQALGYLGADGDKPKDKDNKEAAPKAPSDPILDKITASLQQQAAQAKASGNDSQISDISRRYDDQLSRQRSDMLRDMSYYRRGRLIQLPLPDDALRQLDSLKQQYDAQKNAYADGSARRSDEIQKSADNLTGLLNDKTKSGAPRLVPEGTNLYIRNYQGTQAAPARAPSSKAAAPAAQPTAQPSGPSSGQPTAPPSSQPTQPPPTETITQPAMPSSSPTPPTGPSPTAK